MFEMVIDPRQVGGEQHFAHEVIELVKFIRNCPRVDGVKEILLPGDPERRVLAQRQAQGIPIDDGNWDKLLKLAARLKVKGSG